MTENLAKSTEFSMRGYKGDYQVVIKRKGVPVQVETFTVDGETDVDITVTTSTSKVKIISYIYLHIVCLKSICRD